MKRLLLLLAIFIGSSLQFLMAQEWLSSSVPRKSKGTAYSQFGESVAIDGNYAVVGSPGEGYRGVAYVYYFDGNIWQMQATLSDTRKTLISGQFGNAVAISGNTIVVAAYKNGSNNSGSVFIFEKHETGWTDMTAISAELVPSDLSDRDMFGSSVGISGNTVIVGAQLAGPMNYGVGEGGPGRAYIFEKPAEGWSGTVGESAILTASNGTDFARFGAAVSIANTTAIVGAYNSQRVYIFEQPASGWADMTEDAILTASDRLNKDLYGVSVDISDNLIAVGAEANEGKGAAYLYEKPAEGWISATETVKVVASDGASGDVFGCAVQVNKNVLVVGNYLDDESKTDGGAVYTYPKPAEGWSALAVHSQKLMPRNSSSFYKEDKIGNTIALTEQHMVVGNLQASYTYTAHFYRANFAPRQVQVIPDQQAVASSPFQFVLPEGIFEDTEGDDIVITVDEQSLPPWLTFDSASLTFTGTATNADAGQDSILVTGTDVKNSSTQASFVLTVLVNSTPYYADTISGWSVEANDTLYVSVIFADAENDTLTYRAILEDENILPDWISVSKDIGALNIRATPDSSQVGTLKLKISAFDGGSTSSQIFSLVVLADTTNVDTIDNPTVGVPANPNPGTEDPIAEPDEPFEEPGPGVVTSVSVDDEIKIQPYRLYPNPVVNDYATIEFDEEIGMIEIIDIRGQRLIYNPKFRFKEKLNVSGLRPGIYQLVITYDKKRSSLRFVKQ